MSTKHTPGPWTIDGPLEGQTYIISGLHHSKAEPIICRIFDSSYIELPQQEANARRIASCVNACEGINPDAVQELLKNLIIATNYLERVDGGNEHTKRQIEHLRKLIAKATTI